MWTTISASTIYRYYLSGVLGSRECYVLDCVQNTNDCYDVYSVVCRYWSFRYRTRDNTTSEAPKTLQDVSFDRHDKTKTQFTPYKVYNQRRRPFPIIVNFLYQQIISHVKILYDWWVSTLGGVFPLSQNSEFLQVNSFGYVGMMYRWGTKEINQLWPIVCFIFTNNIGKSNCYLG